jgi:hypothetical protein
MGFLGVEHSLNPFLLSETDVSSKGEEINRPESSKHWKNPGADFHPPSPRLPPSKNYGEIKWRDKRVGPEVFRTCFSVF